MSLITARAPRSGIAQAWQPLIAVLGAAYLAEVIVLTIRLYNLR